MYFSRLQKLLLLWLALPVVLFAQGASPVASLTPQVDQGQIGALDQISEPIPPSASPAPAIWTSFQLSKIPPFSGRIAFTADIEGSKKILQLDLSTKKVASLIDGPGNNYFPSWSPDGKTLAFVSDRDGNREIYVSDWRGENQKRITNNSLPDDNPSWHPDGKRIVFYRDEDPANSDIFVIDSGGDATARRITELGGRNTAPWFHPDGSRVMYSTNRFWPGWDVCEWNPRAQNEYCYLKGNDSYCRAAWSADGKFIAYTYGVSPELTIGIYDVQARDNLEVSDLPLREYDVKFINDGKHLLFVAEAGVRDLFRLHYLPFGETSPVKLLDGDYSVRYPSWSGKSTLEIEAERIKEQEALKEAERAQRLEEAQEEIKDLATP